MKCIHLAGGLKAKVDEEDYEEMTQTKWSVVKIGSTNYARRCKGPKGKVKRIYMHRQIMGAKKGQIIDHKDGNGLNNTRSNLRVCTHSGNMQNQKRNKRNKSGYKGVSWCKRDAVWRAYICKDGKRRALGTFRDVKDAAIAYDVASRKLHGEFSKTNFKI